jgi:hypothetical protein
MEQFVRDARITTIFEGANGIQALDLVGRKLAKDGGRAFKAFLAEVAGYIKERDNVAAMASYVKPLERALGDLREATTWFAENAPGDPDNAGSGSTDYMQLFGLVALGYMWCLMVDAAKAKGADGNSIATTLEQKFVLARFFMEKMLPATTAHLARIKTGAASTMALPADAF